jgi:class 3 adenylate cyclase
VAALGVHAVVFAVVNAFIVVVWLLTGGSVDTLRDLGDDPSGVAADVWPMWVIVPWTAGLLLHAGIHVALFPRRARRRRRRRRQHRLEQAATAQPGRPAPGRRWVVAMFTDIAGSTDLAESLGDDEWARVLADHRRQVRATVARHSGREVGTQGDGFLVRFDRPIEAVSCAVALQQELEGAREAGRFTPQIRVGIHAGDAFTDDDDDLVGRVVNLAARVMATASPGEVVVTEPVADQLDASVDLVDKGLQALRGVARPRHLLAVEWRPPLAGGRPVSEAAAPPRSPTADR